VLCDCSVPCGCAVLCGLLGVVGDSMVVTAVVSWRLSVEVGRSFATSLFFVCVGERGWTSRVGAV
jgi:hypothetical protein